MFKIFLKSYSLKLTNFDGEMTENFRTQSERMLHVCLYYLVWWIIIIIKMVLFYLFI